VHIGGGYSMYRGGVYSLEAGPSLAIGYAEAEEPIPGLIDDYSGNGAYVRFGAGATNLFTFGTFQLGLTAGVASILAFVNYDARDVFFNGQTVHLDSVEATYKGTMIFAQVSLAARRRAHRGSRS
jgi:hypothetical protein